MRIYLMTDELSVGRGIGLSVGTAPGMVPGKVYDRPGMLPILQG